MATRRSRERAGPIGDDLERAKERALGLLAVRPRSHAELADRLRRAGATDEVVARVREDLQRVGLLDDEGFARDLAAHRIGNRLEGRRAVASALRAKGLDAGLVERVLEDAGDDDERAERLARSRASRLSKEPPERAFTRLLGFLQRRGYAYPVAARAARRALGVDTELD